MNHEKVPDLRPVPPSIQQHAYINGAYIAMARHERSSWGEHEEGPVAQSQSQVCGLIRTVEAEDALLLSFVGSHQIVSQ